MCVSFQKFTPKCMTWPIFLANPLTIRRIDRINGLDLKASLSPVCLAVFCQNLVSIHAYRRCCMDCYV